MAGRRTFLQLAAAAATLPALAWLQRTLAPMNSSHQTYAPIVVNAPTPIPPTATIMPPTAVPTATLEPTSQPPTVAPTQIVPPSNATILGSASGTLDQAARWLIARADQSYTDYDLQTLIVPAYQQLGDSVNLDWFLAIAQNCLETGSMTSFWSLRPQRNPAGLGVTGVWRAADDPPPDPQGWAFNTQRNRWEVGLSFGDWVQDAIPAHLGRLLAYALRDEQATPAQLDLIRYALRLRPLPERLRGSAVTYLDLNGRWATGDQYGEKILDLADRMRRG